MTPDELVQLRSQLTGHEGLRQRAYVDTMNKITIGVGRNLTDKGLSLSEVQMLLDNDITECVDDLTHAYPWFLSLDITRQHALIDLRFQLGGAGLSMFPKFLHAMAVKDYATAAQELRTSRLAAQVPNRVKDVSQMIEQGA